MLLCGRPETEEVEVEEGHKMEEDGKEMEEEKWGREAEYIREQHNCACGRLKVTNLRFCAAAQRS